MKLVSLRIHNFRAIRDAQLEFSDYSLLIGANNAGKSTVVDCIRAVYEKDKFKFSKERDFPSMARADESSWVDLNYSLSDEEMGGLAEKYHQRDRCLRLRKVFIDPDDKSRNGVLYGYLADGTLDTGAFYGAKGVQNGKLGELIYIPAVSTVDEHTKLSGPSALRDLLVDMLGGVLQGSESYETFSGEFGKFVELIRKEEAGEGRSLNAFEHDMNYRLARWGTGFRLNFKPPSAQDLIKSLLGWNVLDELGEEAAGPGRFGSGFQRHFIFSIITVGAKYANRAAPKKEKDFSPQLTLLLFEEPEVFLHPPQQSQLSKDLRELSRTGVWQVISSTHSPHFVTRNASDVPSMIRLRNDRGDSRAFQISESQWDQLLQQRSELERIVGGADKLSEDEKQQLEALRYYLWLNPDKCGMFFSDVVYLVEGLSEVALLNRLIDDGRIETGNREAYVLSAEGKFNLYRFMNLATLLGMPHVVLFDDDGGGGNHKELNKLITDSADQEFTLHIHAVKGDLEKHLEMPKLEGSIDQRRKPQLILMRYEQQAYKPERLDELCASLSLDIREQEEGRFGEVVPGPAPAREL